MSAVGAAFVAVLQPALLVPLSPKLAELAIDMGHGWRASLNTADMKKLQRGYYEDLGDVTRFNSELWIMYGGKPKGWDQSLQTRERTDTIGDEFVPSTEGLFKGALRRNNNSQGLRDREYLLEPFPNTFRIGLVGASHDAGAGVNDDETYENVVEDRLNRRGGTEDRQKVRDSELLAWRVQPHTEALGH